MVSVEDDGRELHQKSKRRRKMWCQWRTTVGSCIRRVGEGERCGVSGRRWSGVASESEE